MLQAPKYEKYKSGNITYLDEVPEHWAVRRIKYLFAELDDRSLDGSETLLSLRMNEGLVAHDDVSDKPIKDDVLVGYKRVQPGHLVMNRMRAAIGLFGIATIPGIVSPDYAIFQHADNLSIRYYLYLFKTQFLKNVFLLESKGLGTGSSGFLRLYSDRFGQIKVPLPPIEEQKRIVDFLDRKTAEIDEAIAQKQRLIELLQEQKAILINQAVTKGLNPDAESYTQDSLSAKYISGNWKLTPIKYLVKTRKGVAFKSNNFCGRGVPVVKASDIKNNTINQGNVYLPSSFVDMYPKAVLKSGETILSTVGSVPEVRESAVGQIGTVPTELDGSLLNQNTVVFSLITPEVSKQFFEYFLNSRVYRNHLDLHAHGSANQASLNVSDMLNFSFAYPPLSQQVKIVDFLDNALLNLRYVENDIIEEIKLILELKATLVARTVIGQVKV